MAISLFAVRYIADLLMIDREKAVQRLNRSPLIHGAFRVADISDLVAWESFDDEAFEEAKRT